MPHRLTCLPSTVGFFSVLLWTGADDVPVEQSSYGLATKVSLSVAPGGYRQGEPPTLITPVCLGGITCCALESCN